MDRYKDPFYFMDDLDLKYENKIKYISGVEGFYGSDYNNKFIGSDFQENIVGNGGSDTIYGNGGGDLIRGDCFKNSFNFNTNFSTKSSLGYSDYLDGGEGDDTILGDQGDDTLIGGLGTDTLTGGTGADRFVFSADGGKDKIMDFSTVDGDRIVFDAASFGLSAGSSMAAYLVFGTAALKADHGYFIANENRVWWDADGSGSGEAQQLVLFDKAIWGLNSTQFLFA